MQVTQTSADGLKREFKVVVDANDIEARIEGRLEELQRSARIPGFRPGKAPVSLLRKRYGDSLRGEVLEQALTETSSQALAEQNARPATQPQIEVTRFEEGGDLEYTLAVELLPDIEPGDFGDLKLTRYVAEVGDADVDETLANIAAREKNYVPVETPRKAKKGDAVVIDFAGTIDGEPIEGGSGSDHVLELGANAFVEGFEEQLIGAKPGDHVTVEVTLPKEFVNEAMAGKDAVFEVDVKEIQEVEPVPIDDAFAKSHGFPDLDAMRAAVREQQEREYASISRARLKRTLLDALADRYDFPVPEGMVDIEFDSIWERVMEDKKEGRLDPSDVGRSDDELRAEYRAIAERRVRLGLLLSEVGRAHNVTVEQDELNRAIAERARAFPGHEDRVVQFYRDNPQAMSELRAPLFEDKVVDLVIGMADVTDKPVPIDELLREPDDAAQEAEGGKKPGKKPAKKAAKKGSAKAKGGKAKAGKAEPKTAKAAKGKAATKE